MCLALPVKIIKITGTIAEVDIGGTRRQADIRCIDAVKPGDYILVHAGFAIEKIDAKEAEETLKVLRDIYYD
jgi:hydrogenase expression/formation protein HypC